MLGLKTKNILTVILYSYAASSVSEDKPMEPNLLDKSNVTDCQGCLLWSNQAVLMMIHCDVTVQDGYNVSSVRITVGGIERNTAYANGLYQYYYKVSRDSHRQEVTCEVVYSGIDQPLVDTSRIYVISEPRAISLHSAPQVEGSPSSLSCSSSPGRPPPQLSFLVDGSRVIASQLDVWRPLNDTFRSIARLDILHREWNGETVTCCMTFIRDSRLNTHHTCADTRKIHYIYNANSIQLDARLDIKNISRIHLECTIRNANPPCQAQWVYPGPWKPDRETRTHVEKTGFGFTTHTISAMNVTEHDQGQMIQCRAICYRATPVLTARYTIDIWKIRDESNVTNIDQSGRPMRSRGTNVLETMLIYLIPILLSFIRRS